jgi:hypothetical protein
MNTIPKIRLRETIASEYIVAMWNNFLHWATKYIAPATYTGRHPATILVLGACSKTQQADVGAYQICRRHMTLNSMSPHIHPDIHLSFLVMPVFPKFHKFTRCDNGPLIHKFTHDLLQGQITISGCLSHCSMRFSWGGIWFPSRLDRIQTVDKVVRYDWAEMGFLWVDTACITYFQNYKW